MEFVGKNVYIKIYNHVGRAGFRCSTSSAGRVSCLGVCVWTLIPSLLLRDGTASLVG